MKTENSYSSSDHIDDLRLPYLEDLLEPDEKAKVEEHLRNCSHCSEAIQELSRFVTTVQINKEMMCPEPWEIFDSERREDKASSLSSHTDRCPTCSDYRTAFKEEVTETAMPRQLWRRVQSSVKEKEEVPRQSAVEGWLEILRAKWFEFFRVPAIALSAVAAAALLFVILYPRTELSPVIALSQTQWAEDLKFMGETVPTPVPAGKKERLAIILFLKDFSQRPPQSDLDYWYQSLNPSKKLGTQYDVLQPLDFERAVAEAKIKVERRSDILKGLREVFKASQALLVTLTPSGNQFEINSELLETSTGKMLKDLRRKDVPESELGSELRSTALSTLEAR